MKASLTSITSLALLFVACGEDAIEAPTGPGLSIEVAPLSLPGIVEATYELTVKSSGGAVVWTKSPIASTRYGDGQGAITYVGPCDADGGLHTVELVLLSLTDAVNGDLSSPGDFVNPTIQPGGARTPIVVAGVVCNPNADTLVPISLTVMRAARQGFFDIAVEFDDIFCSAKLDCSPSLLHNGDDRAATAILAFACASGNGQPTNMYLSDLTLTCTGAGGTTTLDVNPFRRGNQGRQGAGVFQWAVYQGREFLDVNGESPVEKCYWNHAIGLDLASLAGQSCTLSATGTATDESLPRSGDQYTLPRTGSYPYIRWSGEVLTSSGQVCDNMALGSAEVSTEYVRFDTATGDLPPLTARLSCGGPQQLACATGAGTFGVTPTEGGFELSGDAVPTRSFNLPAGYSVGGSCCTPDCCQ
jgi:hypothetical protein